MYIAVLLSKIGIIKRKPEFDIIVQNTIVTDLHLLLLQGMCCYTEPLPYAALEESSISSGLALDSVFFPMTTS